MEVSLVSTAVTVPSAMYRRSSCQWLQRFCHGRVTLPFLRLCVFCKESDCRNCSNRVSNNSVKMVNLHLMGSSLLTPPPPAQIRLLVGYEGIFPSGRLCSAAYSSYQQRSTYFLEVLGLLAVLGLPDFPLEPFGFMACSAPSAVYARYTCDRSGSSNCQLTANKLHFKKGKTRGN